MNYALRSELIFITLPHSNYFCEDVSYPLPKGFYKAWGLFRLPGLLPKISTSFPLFFFLSGFFYGSFTLAAKSQRLHIHRCYFSTPHG
jgi:hypothetical protein